MSETAQAGSGEPATRDWQIRTADERDVEGVARAVGELLVELGGASPEVSAMQEAVRSLIGDTHAGAVLVAEADGGIAGVIAASWQIAIHVPGRYGLIQDLWVDPRWRSRAIGAELIEALVEIARGMQMQRVEVGLPRERFIGFAATEAFYVRNGFEPLGPRLRRVLQ